ncbi:MAG: gliding motility-associated C-terminal domain-containing protein [Bacteroidetes bacterium]|nr:gliding motility-associated C-terminal domain-containing protein [Bacteroidota bacterium]
MIKFYVRNILLVFILLNFSNSILFGQATIKVTVTSILSSPSVDCDNLFFDITGESDFVWEYTATDNTIGYSNNNPALFGVYNFNYTNTSGNGPINASVDNLFFDRQYICPSDVPTAINLTWEAYENDDVGDFDITGNTDGETGLQNVTMAIPSATGIVNYSFSASGSSGCPTAVNYSINFSVERIDFTPTVIILPDNICNAQLLDLNTSYNIALCQGNTLESNEPRAGDVNANQSSAWLKFIAPPTGEVTITTDLGGTEIGTYFQIYHAADGGDCSSGLEFLTGNVIKDKFEYLSHIEFSDGIDLAGIDPEAELTLNACDPIPFVSYQKLIAGETYYVQLTGDDDEAGIVEFRVNSEGSGTGANPEDIPCLSPTVTYGQTPISTGNTESVNLSFGCAYDGGNDYGETGSPHQDNNPIHYHAYDYDNNAFNNPVVNESVWFNFTAPPSGRISVESDYLNALYGENNALFGYDKSFAPGIPSDYLCSNLSFISADEGGTNSFLGGDPSAIIVASCLEPGFNYYAMVDPSDNLTPLNAQEIKSWVFDPSVSDPSNNAPGNDILCLAIQNPIYEVPVILSGTDPTFQAVAGSNVFGCQEFLAGEPNATPTNNTHANQTVWHYFTAPPSGTVEISLRAYIGMDTLRFNVYELLNGDNCYGGLNPATFTQDGTRNTPTINPIISGSAGYNGQQVSACCMEPGSKYAIQLDGGSPGDQGQYIIEYIKELEINAGNIFAAYPSGDSVFVNSNDTIFICSGSSVNLGLSLNALGQETQVLPSCLSSGFVLHQISNVSDADLTPSFTYIDTLQGTNTTLVNDTDGLGSFGNPLFNTVYYISPAGDITNEWGEFNCVTSTISNGIPVVFLETLYAGIVYDNVTCTATFSVYGGLYGYNINLYPYTITSPSGVVVDTGLIAPGASISFTGSEPGQYTIFFDDALCPQTYTFDGTNCNNPCTPVVTNVSLTICTGESVVLEGQAQNTPGVYTDVFITSQGCDSTVITNLSISDNYNLNVNYYICPGGSVQIGNSIYSEQGVYIDTLQSVYGCDSIVNSVLFIVQNPSANITETICSGTIYSFNGIPIEEEGVYSSVFTSSLGCDSTVVLSLFVTPPNSSYQTAEICIGEEYEFNGNMYSTSGIIYDTINITGCDSILVLELSVIDCEFQISNILTPNEDGQNDTWRVSDLSKIAGCDVEIYNRWGELVFETNDYNNQWAGTRQNEQLPDGVYFYSIKCSNTDEKPYTGEINLLRFKK